MTLTIQYYNTHAQTFSENTKELAFTEVQDRFLRRLPSGASVLDFGCGSGRDTKYFLKRGFSVEAIDGSEELCRLASEYTGIPVKQMYFDQLDAYEKYDGIWACASVLHLDKQGLIDVMRKMERAVKPEGLIYTSFKYGEFEGERNGRYFTCFSENSFARFMNDLACPAIRIEEQWITTDVRPGRSDERWLNIILRKSVRL